MAYKSHIPLPILEGGTDATSFGTIDGTVYYNGTNLVVTATGTANFVLTSNGVGMAPTYQAVSASGAVTSVSGGNNITITGTATAPIVNVSGTTQYAVQIGNATNSLSSVSPSVTSGVPLISQGAASNPAFGTAVVAGGGTGIITTTAYAPICGGTTATGNFQAASTGLGTSGFILTSTGAASLPSFQAPAASSISITGNSGGALTGNAFTFSGGTTGLSFGGSGSTETLTFAGITANAGVVALGTDATDNAINIGTAANTGRTTTVGNATGTSSVAINCGTGGVTVGTSANAHATTIGSTTASATTTIQGPSAGVFALGVQGVAVSNKNYVTINTATGALGSDSAPLTSISITGNSGGALTGSAFTFTGGTTGLTFSGAGTTETLTGTLAIANGGTNATSMATTDGTVIYDGTRLVTLASTGTSGQALVSAGAGVAPAYGTLPIAGGGTNATSMTNTDGVVYYDGTRLVTTAVGTATNILTSNGAGMAPTFQAPAASSITITGDSGGGLTGSSFTFTGGTTGLTFAGAGTTETLGGTLAIANGGTDATSFSTSTGIVKYDGTRLVSSSTAKIDSSNRMTNSSQPAFSVVLASAVSNVTGDATLYTCVWDTVVFDQGSNFSSATFTAPITGRYFFTCGVLFSGLTAADTSGSISISCTSRTFVGMNLNPGVVANSGQYCATQSCFVDMSANDTAVVKMKASGSTKTVSFGASSSTDVRSWFSGYLVC